MWSIPIVVGIATAASAVLLATGIVLAVAIERRRHIKYVKKHIAGINGQNRPVCCQRAGHRDCTQSYPINSSLAERQIKRVAQFMPPSLLLPENGERKSKSTTLLSAVNQTRPKKNSLHKTIRTPIERKHRGRRRLTRTLPLGYLLSSPLSAIAETSDVSCSSPSSEHARVSSATSWKAGQTPKSDKESPSLEHIRHQRREIAVTRPLPTPGSGGMVSPALSVPHDSRALSPTLRSPQKVTTRPQSHIASEHIEAAGSLVSKIKVSSPEKNVIPVEKTQSRALAEFNFGLATIIDARSPAKSKCKDGITQEVLAIGSLQECNDSASPLKCSNTANLVKPRPGSVLPVLKRVSSRVTGPPGRHSMFGNGTAFDSRSQILTSEPSTDENDPFVTRITRPVSPKTRMPLSELDEKSVASRNPVNPFGFDRARARHSCFVESTLPILGPSPALRRDTRTVYFEKGLGFREHTVTKPKRPVVDHVQNTDNRGSPIPRKPGPQRKDKDSDRFNFGQALSLTSSNASLNEKWSFNIDVPDTPKISIPPSPFCSHDSPILPPPVHIPAKFQQDPKGSRLRGPRSPLNLRLQKSPKLERESQDHKVCHRPAPHSVSKVNNPTSLPKPVAALRSANSDYNSTESFHDTDCPKPGKLRRGEQGSSFPQTSRTIRREEQSKVRMSSPNRTQTTIGSPLVHKVSSLTVMQGPTLAPSQSSASIGGTSVWDDASVHEELSEVDTMEPSKNLTPAKRESCLLGSTPAASRDIILSSDDGTPRAKMEDYDTLESYVQNYGRNQPPSWLWMGKGASSTPGRETNSARKLKGLGLHMPNSALLDTPRSLYDHNGFLKEIA